MPTHIKACQSPVPDLIYPSQQWERVQEIYPYLKAPEDFAPGQLFHRITLFLTYRCNLACPYCKTILRSSEEAQQKPHKRLSYDLASLKKLLLGLAPSLLLHLHFTGGEAVLNPEMPEMIQFAKQRGVKFISVTSNGALPVSRYLALVEVGINEIRISLDAGNAHLGSRLTQRQGAWEKTIETIQALAQESRKRADFYLIVNTVVGLKNYQELPEILRFVLSLGPDDIKLITEVDVKQELGDLKQKNALIAQAQALLADYPATAFPLLRRKLDTVFEAESIGLAKVSTPQNGQWHCFIPLSERTVDAQYYYPCSVYLREGGSPLGELSDSPQIQYQKTARFVREENCLSDPICQKYCLHCTREFNQLANAALT
ncbi:MAG: radical SAM protein [Candidatus Sericytochromatia bacterium]